MPQLSQLLKLPTLLRVCGWERVKPINSSPDKKKLIVIIAYESLQCYVPRVDTPIHANVAAISVGMIEMPIHHVRDYWVDLVNSLNQIQATYALAP